MNAKDKKELKVKILERIAQAEKEIVHLEEITKPIAPENSIGRVSRMDAINNKGVAEATLRSAKRKISKLKIALSKLDQPGFGSCENCHKPIQVARLMFMPESTKCMRCAK